MTRSRHLHLGALLLGLMLSGCATHHPASANCFNFRTGSPSGVSAKPNVVTRANTTCAFTALGPAR